MSELELQGGIMINHFHLMADAMFIAALMGGVVGSDNGFGWD